MGALKEVVLEIIPLSEILTHWAIRIGSGESSRVYEFDAQGVVIGKNTALDHGYPKKLRELGPTQRSHQEIQAWANDFASTNEYSAMGSGQFVEFGKNCQDFVFDLCFFLGVDTGKLPPRQAKVV